MKKLIWAMAFVNEFSRERRFKLKYGGDPGDIPAYSCAETAEVAVEKYEEVAEAGPDYEFLTCLQKIMEKE